MKFTIYYLFLFLIFSSCQEYRDIDKGVPIEYAKERKKKISDLNYKIHFNIPIVKADSILSQNMITFNLSDRN